MSLRARVRPDDLLLRQWALLLHTFAVIASAWVLFLRGVVFPLPSPYYHLILHLSCCHLGQRCSHNCQNCVSVVLNEAPLLFQSLECFDLQVCHNYLGLRILRWWKWPPSKETASAGQSLMGFAGVFYAGCSPRHRGDLSYPINWSMKPAHEISQ